jgi:valyl-tRNA synthetase
VLDKNFTPGSFEKEIYEKTESYFSAKLDSDKKDYTIMMPPPNVTGSLHLGHALTYTLQDVLVRFKRLCNYDVLWQPGTDHAGIATQIVVERQLAEKNITRHDLGKDEFIKKVWEWKAESGSTIVEQQRRLGISPDWDRSRFTMDEGLTQAVKKVFVDLHAKGLIYRDKRLVNWDTKLQTAISDIEVENQDVKGNFWYISYQLEEDSEQSLIIATTRPETLFGDTAVAVHPEDERYQAFIGKKVKVPLTGRTVTVIADTYCDPEKGSGAVKITPAHDFNDFEVGQRHQLEKINILNADGTLNENVPISYQGLTANAGRAKVVTDLEEQGLLVKIEPTAHAVPYSERSGVEIQPWLTDQWFVDAKTLAAPAIAAVEKGQTRFVPEQYNATYFEWLNNIQPWCISRQIWWGHPIPAWYGPDGHIFVALTAEEATIDAEKHYGKSTVLRQDQDVLDTWFSSALWPFSTLGWPEQTPELKRYYPTDVLVTGNDILFFWVARMMMMGIHFMGEVPFHTVYLHALVRDERGQKMSKSKGNIIDPLHLIDKYSCDALRFTLSSLAAPGRDIKLSESRVEGSRNFITKIWNATRFLQMNECAYNPDFDPTKCTNIINRWIVSEVAELSNKVYTALEDYRFDHAANHIYQFTWGIFCDYYLEFLKPSLSNPDSQQEEARQAAAWVLVQILHIAHPFMPLITEKIWQEFTGNSDFIAQRSWPSYGAAEIDSNFVDKNAETQMRWTIQLITEIRSLRGLLGVPVRAEVPLVSYKEDSETETHLKEQNNLITFLARVSEVIFTEERDTTAGSVHFHVGKDSFSLRVGQFIDIAAAHKLLETRLEKLNQESTHLTTKLKNEAYRNAKPDQYQDDVETLKNKTSEAERLQAILRGWE